MDDDATLQDETESRAPVRRRPGARRYVATLPERLARAAVALVGGAVYETSLVALPRAVRDAKLYQVTIDRLLRIMIEWVGDVRDIYEDEETSVEELAARKFAGNLVEWASIFAVGWSPLWLLAAASDVMGGSKVYLRTLVQELQDAGRLPAEASVASYEELLGRLEAGSGVLADAIDIPPMSVAEARASFAALRGRRAACRLPRNWPRFSRSCRRQRDARIVRCSTSRPRWRWLRRGLASMSATPTSSTFTGMRLAPSATRGCYASCAGWRRPTSRAPAATSTRARRPTPTASLGGSIGDANARRSIPTRTWDAGVNLRKSGCGAGCPGTFETRPGSKRVHAGATPRPIIECHHPSGRPRSHGFATTPLSA